MKVAAVGDAAMTSTERSQRLRAKRREAGISRVRSPAEIAAIKAWKVSPAGRASRTRHNHDLIDARIFVGCDGEGCGTDAVGRQPFLLWRMGDRELCTGGELTTSQLLEFILGSEPDTTHTKVIYGGRYDVPQMLRDIPAERWGELWRPKPRQQGKSMYFFYGKYGIDWRDGHYLRVCRLMRSGRGWAAQKGTARTIYEVSGFFQKRFVDALADFAVGEADHLAFIGLNKDLRGSIAAIDDQTRRYCALECRYLAELMTRFRTLCLSLDPPLRPRTWNGAGKLAEAEHAARGTITGKALQARLVALSDTGQAVPVPPASPTRGVLAFARRGYYGGRFEMTRLGEIPGPVWGYDINSAYPFACLSLPCLIHGTWAYVDGTTLDYLTAPDALYIADVAFHHPQPRLVCGLPFRTPKGTLQWPVRGNGTYWSVEIRAAEKLGAEIRHKGGWLYQGQCDCQPFRWVSERYEQRLKFGKDAAGMPLKFMLNSLYGKLAQRKGKPVFANPIYAGLITATTRAQLIDAAAVEPDSVIMFATDAVFTARPLKHLTVSKALGAWDMTEHPRLFCVQPGLYWGLIKDKIKTRGISPRFMRPLLPTFERTWADWCDGMRAATRTEDLPIPRVGVSVEYFVGMRLAYHRHKPDLAGRWMKAGEADNPPRQIAFDWTKKRGKRAFDTSRSIVTLPLPGDKAGISTTFDAVDDAAMLEWDEFRMRLEANRDWHVGEPEMDDAGGDDLD